MIKIAAVSLLILIACSNKSGSPPSDEPAPATTEPAPATGNDDAGDDGTAAKLCKPTGCSGIVCSTQDVITTCEFKPEYACYQKATCEQQSDGACGWTKSAELDACLASPPPP